MTIGYTGPPVGTFLFNEFEVEAFMARGKWHLRSAGHESRADDLGRAARVLFNPLFHEDTSPLVLDILRWHESLDHARVT